jgi:hypothetical protein
MVSSRTVRTVQLRRPNPVYDCAYLQLPVTESRKVCNAYADSARRCQMSTCGSIRVMMMVEGREYDVTQVHVTGEILGLFREAVR